MLNKPVSDFALPGTGGKEFRLSAAESRLLVLYFYPKDNTPGCTNEGAQFRDLHAQFQKAGCAVLGVSRDSLRSHENFKAKMGFPFELLSDETEKVCGQFGVMKMKNLYGKKVRGIERSTFVLHRDRVLRREWRGQKVPGPPREGLIFLKPSGPASRFRSRSFAQIRASPPHQIAVRHET